MKPQFHFSNFSFLLFSLFILFSFHSCKDNNSLKFNSSGIKEFSFNSVNNDLLNRDIVLEVSDSVIIFRTPYNLDISSLTPSFVLSSNSKLYVDSTLQVSGESTHDFTEPVTYTFVDQEGNSVKYDVQIVNFTNLPVLSIETEEKIPVTTKEYYLAASYKLDGMGVFEDIEGDIEIRGRGHSTWGMPKKPYKLKLGKKKRLLGMSNSKHWVMLQNYADKSMLRIHTAFYMGEISQLDWTPGSAFVELFLNDEHMGTYQLTEHIRDDKERVNVSSNGYILEVDQESRMTEEDRWFKTDGLDILFSIKKPEIEYSDERFAIIKDWINSTEKALYGPDFLDEKTGYKNYLDIESFVDWYLVNEISKNPDAEFFSSCYMNYEPGGKLKMGPLWDFDIAFGNNDYKPQYRVPEGFHIKYTDWFSRMFDDPEFVELVKERFNYFKERKPDIFESITSNSLQLKWSVLENNQKWQTLTNKSSEQFTYKKYYAEVDELKNWLDKRFQWLEKAFDEL